MNVLVQGFNIRKEFSHGRSILVAAVGSTLVA
jgi:hypothetical protein